MKRKAKIVVCALQKGGVGKSSVVRNLSFALFQRGVRVCMVDFDPQANLTMSCGIDKPNEIPITIGHLMDAEIKGTERPNKEDYIRSSDGVDFIPSSNYLSAIEFDMRLEIGCERLLGFVLEDIREDYDYIIIDIGPTEGTLSANALTCSDGILIPSDLQLFSMAGVSQVLTTSIKLRRRVNPDLQVIGIVFNRYETRTNLSQEVLANMKATYGGTVHLFDAAVPQSVHIGEAHYHGKPVGLLKPMSKSAIAFQRLAEEFMNRCPIEKGCDE